MKKLFFLAMFMTFAMTASAQFSAGATFGIPTGDADEAYTFALGLDVNYMFESDSEFSYGVATGYLTYFGDEITVLGTTVEIDNASFLPVAAAARYAASEKFSLGADVGYAIGLAPDGNDVPIFRNEKSASEGGKPSQASRSKNLHHSRQDVFDRLRA